jgi:hypothetical protein
MRAAAAPPPPPKLQGMVVGKIGTGRVSSAATAMGKDAAQSNVEGMSFNALGAQNTVSSNLAFTAGAAKTAVKAAALTAAGPTVSSGLSNALGVKSASSSARGSSNTGLGVSASSVFANSLTAGTANSSADVLATALFGPSFTSGGSLGTSLQGDASAHTKSKTLSGGAGGRRGRTQPGSSPRLARAWPPTPGAPARGSAGDQQVPASMQALPRVKRDQPTQSPQPHPPHPFPPNCAAMGTAKSMSGATSIGRDASDASTTTNSTSLKGKASSAAGSLALGTFTDSDSASLATAKNGSAYAASDATSTGATSAASRSRSTARTTTGRKTSHSTSKSRAGTAQRGLFGGMPALLPPVPSLASLAAYKGSSAASILAGALAKSAGLKALLPKVPGITPGLPEDAPEYVAAVAAGNISDAAAANATQAAAMNETQREEQRKKEEQVNATFGAIAGMFDGLMDKHRNFTARNAPPGPGGFYGSLAAAPSPPPPPPGKRSARVEVPYHKLPPAPGAPPKKAAEAGAARPAGGQLALPKKPVPRPQRRR